MVCVSCSRWVKSSAWTLRLGSRVDANGAVVHEDAELWEVKVR